MKCPSEIELNEYAGDRLATQRRWEVAQHLQDCPGCRTDLEDLEWAAQALGCLADCDLDDADHAPAEDLAALRDGRLPHARRAEVLSHLSLCPECAGIYGQLPREKRELPLTRHWQPMAAAAGLLLVIGLVFFVARGQLAPGAMNMESAPRAARVAPAPMAQAVQPSAKALAPEVVAAPSAGSHALATHEHRAASKQMVTAVVTPHPKRVIRPVAPPKPRSDDLAAMLRSSTTSRAPVLMIAPPAPDEGEKPEAALPAPAPPVARTGATALTMKGMSVPPAAKAADMATASGSGGGFRAAMAPEGGVASRSAGAPGAAAGVASAPTQAEAMLLNALPELYGFSLDSLRSNPQLKAKLKTALKQMLRGEKSPERKATIAEALRLLERSDAG
jgi:hypothetical protein